MALKLWAKLDETSGLVASDSSGNGYNGTILNSNGSGIWQPGIIDGSYNLDGVDDYGYFPAASFANAGIWTLSFWFKFTGTSIMRVFGKWGGTSWIGAVANPTANLLAPGHPAYPGRIAVRLRVGSGNEVAVTSIVNDGLWHHYVLKHDTFRERVYTDNVLTGNITYTNSSLWYPGLFYFGNNNVSGGGGVFNGGFDQIKTFDTALSEAEIAQLYQEGHPILCWNYKARYKNSNRMYETRGGGKFPSELKVPSSVDVSTGLMIDEGKVIANNQFKVIQ